VHKKVTEDSATNEVLFLVQNGFSFETASLLPDLTRTAYVYTIQIQKGGKVSWDNGDIQFE
jgi:hypothetical protein